MSDFEFGMLELGLFVGFILGCIAATIHHRTGGEAGRKARNAAELAERQKENPA